MNKCYDKNNALLCIGDAVMYVDTQNGRENEGLITDLLPNNQIILNGESGSITVDASDCFYLP